MCNNLLRIYQFTFIKKQSLEHFIGAYSHIKVPAVIAEVANSPKPLSQILISKPSNGPFCTTLFPHSVEQVQISLHSTRGYEFRFDTSNNLLRIYQFTFIKKQSLEHFIGAYSHIKVPAVIAEVANSPKPLSQILISKPSNGPFCTTLFPHSVEQVQISLHSTRGYEFGFDTTKRLISAREYTVRLAECLTIIRKICLIPLVATKVRWQSLYCNYQTRHSKFVFGEPWQAPSSNSWDSSDAGWAGKRCLILGVN
ncbi:hypothetical protein HW555_010059 [Spodoptera exigua]|uniref:Uncharacterized protein n=1 Tax=Spodoptera exigua TaxID=7107 RepID=A0A835GBB7_SPOEX|nr:hypothetical protein HW555_010059 [Spodoptera exigua]